MNPALTPTPTGSGTPKAASDLAVPQCAPVRIGPRPKVFNVHYLASILRNITPMKNALERYGLTSLLLLVAPGIVLAASEFRVGTAVLDITPPLGTPMAGYYHARGADGVLDPLFAKALVVESSGERAAVVTLDIISITRGITDAARASIEKATGIPGDHVMISATHAHTGPELAERGNRSSSFGGETKLVTDYTEGLPARITQAVQSANENLRAAHLSRSRGLCENLSFNRRYYMRDGSVGWNPGKLNPNIVMPAGPSDPEVGILYAEDLQGQPPSRGIATYVNFAMHPDTTGGTKFSADWPGAIGRVLATYHGTNHVTLVGNGTCGNINHCDFFWDGPSSGPYEQQRIATILGASVFQAYKSLQPVAPGALRARSTTAELELPKVTQEEIADAKKTVAATSDDRGGNFMKLVKAYRVLDVAAREGKPYRIEVQAIALGRELAWVSLPGEVFVELGLAIKKRSPFAQTFVVELANESIGYIPDRRSFAEGNYEPESARCAPGSGERLVDAAVNLLQELHKEPGTAKP